MLRRLLLSLALALAFGAAALAQSAVEPVDWTSWDNLASRVERALDGNTRTDSELERLRASVIDWRGRLLAAQKTNASRIAMLRDQVAALGEPPGDGDTEPAEIAERRAALQADLKAAQAPALRAAEAWGRADGLVAEIDRTLRERQALALRRQTPSPLRPGSWTAAASRLSELGQAVLADARAGLAGGRDWFARLPLALVLLGLAALILTRGRRWVDRLPAHVTHRTASVPAQEVLAFLASLAQVALPLAGVWLIARGLDFSGILGDRALPLLQALPGAGLLLFGGRWLSRQMFPPDPVTACDGPLGLPAGANDRARRGGLWLSVALAAHQLVEAAGTPLSGMLPPGRAGSGPGAPLSTAEEAAAGVWHLPLVIVGAIALFRMSALLRRAPNLGDTDISPVRLRAAGALGEAGRVVAIVAPLLLLAGYVIAANALLWPMALTLGLGALVLLLQRLGTDLWLLLRGDQRGDGLAPVVIGFAITLAALPFLAVAWGARWSDLAEVWARLGQGISLGNVRLSPGAILTFLVVFAVGYVITRAVQGALVSSVLPRTRIETGAKAALVSGVGYIGVFLAGLAAITSAGIDLSSLAIVAGALSVGIGFGLQNIVSNFISGIILLVERPIAVGDWIAVGGAQGLVRRISVRSTAIQTFDRTTVIVPNSDLITKEVTNWTRGSLAGRIIVPVSVAHGSDTRAVEALLHEIAEAQPSALLDPPPMVAFTGFGAGSLDFEMRLILSDINLGLSVSSEIRHQIIERFAAQGIEVPFAQMDVHLKTRRQHPPPRPAASPEAVPSPAAGSSAMPAGSGMEAVGDEGVASAR